MAEQRLSSTSSSYDLLISKLDQFIRKYYINQFLRGLLITTAVCVALFLIYALIEHQWYLPSGGRKLLLGSYLIIFFGTVGMYVLLPLLRYFRLGQTISNEQAAKILGAHFADMDDKLLNILQLKSESSHRESDLVLASIHQKAEEIKLIPFTKAIDLGQNKKYLKYALPPVLLLVFLLFGAPSIVTDPTYRIINNHQTFERDAPFHFVIDHDKLEVIQYEDFRLQVSVDGDQVPHEAYISVDGYEYRMSKESSDTYSYRFTNVRDDISFRVYAGRYGTGTHELVVLPKPKMLDLKIALDYPRHTGRKDEIVLNTGDLSVPEGTKAVWTIDTKSTDDVLISYADQPQEKLERKGSTSFEYMQRITTDAAYSLALKNKLVHRGDSLAYYINAITDQHPTIDVEAIQDSLEQHIIYLVGSAADDYALTKLYFVYEQVDQYGANKKSAQLPISIPVSNHANYDYILDIENHPLAPGDKLNYYFEVWDNDGVRGAKSAKTATMVFQKKTLEELKLEEEANEELIKDKLKDGIDESKKIREELQKLRERLLQKKQPDWQDKKEMQKIIDRQKELQKNLQQMQDAGAENLKNQELTPEQLQKQERLQELMEEAQDDELQKLMEQIQELMQEMNKEQSIEMTEQFEMNQEQLENQLERLEELYKQLEVEKELNEAIDKLEELAKQLDELSKDTRQDSKPQEQLEQEQEEINKEFEQLQEQLKETLEKNDELEKPMPASDDLPEQMDDAGEDLEDSQESLENQENQNASESQKSASDKMKKMAGNMKGQMQAGSAEQMSEDIETIRQLLENLVTLSFDQEGLVNDINRAIVNTPKYVSLLQDQMKIKDDFQVVQDTLNALAKRQPDIETYVLDKVSEVKHHLKESLSQLEERKKPEANQSQRFTMKNLNDLALMLSESMENMQQQMSGMMSGSQMCENPGGKSSKGNKPNDKISEGQEEMSEQLKKMMENGKKGGNSAKDFAEAAAKQAALRKALQDLAKEHQEQGHGASDELQKIIDEMDKQEIDLVNKRLDNDMLKRQQEILTRLLEAEAAQREREMDKKRKSESGQDQQREIPPSIEEYIKQRKALLEQYQYTSPEMTPYYKRLVDMYYKKLKGA